MPILELGPFLGCAVCHSVKFYSGIVNGYATTMLLLGCGVRGGACPGTRYDHDIHHQYPGLGKRLEAPGLMCAYYHNRGRI